MEARTLKVLEFEKVRRMVAERAATALGKGLAGQLAPSTDADEVSVWQRETTEARSLLDADRVPPLGGIHDVSGSAQRARAGGTLEAPDLLEVADTVMGARRLRAFLLEATAEGVPRADEENASLAEWARRIRTFEPMERALRRCVGDDGELLDRASPLLGKARAEARRLQKGVRERLDSLLRSSTGRRALQEQWVTIRNGRYVVPVKLESRADVPGIVHDRSSTGATLFIEPMPVVEINNRIREAEAEAEKEEIRILRELTAQVAAQHEPLLETLASLASLDLIFAKASLSAEMDAIPPKLNVDGTLHVRSGRHPLLGKSAVPIDVWLGGEHHTLVITGPNTGGKTVTLKTVGLFTLMAQAGLHVPAQAGTQLSIFSQIFADIGDEQSIEQSLSTFSSHMKAIVRILGKVRPGALVLLDELGAGTDPQEGAALARAILEWLTERGSLVIATTHYSELKSFAFAAPLVQNASVDFDPVTLKPTYRLRIGVPGRSNAFKIGGRLGLPDAVLSRAEEVLAPNAIQADELIEGLQRDRQEAASDREEQERLRVELEEALQGARALRRELQQKVGDVVARTRREADGWLRQARRDAERVTAELSRVESDGQGADAHERADRLRRELVGTGKRFGAWVDDALALEGVSAAPTPDRTPTGEDATEKGAAAQGARRVSEGDWVFLDRLGQEGEVIGLSEGSAVVRVGSLKVQVRASELQRVRRGDGGKDVARAEVSTGHGGRVGSEGGGGMAALAREKAQHVAPELDLRGMTVEEGREAVDKYLDDVALGGLQSVRIIHGKGTGTLRKGVRDHLSAHPAVAETRLGGPGEGGDGVTVVQLSSSAGR